MDTHNNTVRNISIVVLIIAAIGAGYWFMTSGAHILPIAAGDTIRSWDFQGAHKDGGANEQKAHDEIARLEAGLKDAETEPTDYLLYVSIANQYVLLGEGKSAYDYLGKALEIDSEKTGMAWHNMGALLEQLGAYNTARIAYDRAAEVQPVVETYHIARVQFLMKHFVEDSAAIESALQHAEQTFGTEYPVILQLRHEWLVSQGKSAEAAAMLEKLQARIKSGTGGGSVMTVE